MQSSITDYYRSPDFSSHRASFLRSLRDRLLVGIDVIKLTERLIVMLYLRLDRFVNNATITNRVKGGQRFHANPPFPQIRFRILACTGAAFFDHNRLAKLPSEESRKFEGMSAGEKLYAMNFDTHLRQIYVPPPPSHFLQA